MARIDLSQIDLPGQRASSQDVSKKTVPVQKVTQKKVEPPGRKLPNFLTAYLEYTSDNEAPESFHLWVGLGTIAAAAQRKVWMETAFFQIHSNLYVVLTAPAGTARKTTALKIGQKLIKEVPNVYFTTKATSPAALITQFTTLQNLDHQSLTCYSYELGTLLSTQPADMVDLITDLYDGNPDWDKQTIARGTETIKRPWLNLLAAVTPQWLGDHLPSTAVEGGLVSRTIFIYEDERKLSSPFPEETEEHRVLRELLINDLTHISTLEGQFKFDPEARAFYEKWYLDPRRFPDIVDNRTGGYYERKHIHVLKVAMLLSLADNDSLTITRKDLDTALRLLSAIEPGMKRSFSAVGKNEFATDIERIFHQIDVCGEVGIERKKLVAANYHALSQEDLEKVLAQLRAMGSVRYDGGRYYSTGGF